MTTVPLRHVADVWTSSVDKHSREGELPVQLCNYVDAYRNDVVRPGPDKMRATATPAEIGRNRLLVGDTVLTKDSEDPRDIGISAYVAETADDFVCGYHLAVARPHSGIHGRFLTWALRGRPALDHLGNHASGISRYGISQTGLRSTPVLALDLEQQRRIADFLDDRIARIDNVISARHRQRSAGASAMDSEWARLTAELEARVDVVPLRRVLGSIVDGPFGSSLTSQHYSDAGTRVVRLGNLGVAAWRDADKAFIDVAYADQLSAHAVLPGDLLMAGLGDERWPLGRCVVAPENLGAAIVKADCYRIRLDSRVNHEFAAVAISSPNSRGRIRLMARGATRPRLNTEIAREIPIPMASRAQQAEYVDVFRDVERFAGAGLSYLERFIQLLTEYKQSLITAAVTGELDVTTAGSGIPG